MADYIQRVRPTRRCNTQFFAQLASLDEAVEFAALSKLPDGKRHPHQRRIPAATLETAHQSLRTAPLRASRSFDGLYETIASTIGNIPGIGPLTTYDVACRVGTHLGLEPDRVYLHAGTRKGARALGLDSRTRSLAVSAFPAALQKLSAAEIEDCLCVYKGHFGALDAPPSRASSFPISRHRVREADFPDSPGVYVLYRSEHDHWPLYVGVAATQSLRKRWTANHLKPRAGGSALRRSLGAYLGLVQQKLKKPDRYYDEAVEQSITDFLESCYLELAATSTAQQATQLEARTIAELAPTLNVAKPTIA